MYVALRFPALWTLRISVRLRHPSLPLIRIPYQVFEYNQDFRLAADALKDQRSLEETWLPKRNLALGAT